MSRAIMLYQYIIIFLPFPSRMVLGKLLAFQGSIHISSVNLMTCMSSLTIIARARPQFLGKVVNALEILHG